MHRRSMRRLSRLSYSVLGSLTGAHITAFAIAFGPLAWQTVIVAAFGGAVWYSARRADRWVAHVIQRAAAEAVSSAARLPR